MAQSITTWRCTRLTATRTTTSRETTTTRAMRSPRLTPMPTSIMGITNPTLTTGMITSTPDTGLRRPKESSGKTIWSRSIE